jgi:EgtB-related family protein
LARALQASRADTLALFQRWCAALPELALPYHPDLNPPRWELGHIGWFQTWWIGRHRARDQGWRADPDLPRAPPALIGADALYDSTRVAHATRWSLPLPSASATLDELARGLRETLALLAGTDSTSTEGLYFYRLALLHEDMHHEAGLYMAQALGVPTDDDPRWQPAPLPAPPAPLRLAAGPWRLGSPAMDELTADALAGPATGRAATPRPGSAGAATPRWGPSRNAGRAGAPTSSLANDLVRTHFAFDNELATHEVPLAAFEIDAQAVRWAEFLPFVEAGGYDEPRWWTDAGWAWRRRNAQAPRYLRRERGQSGQSGHWQRWRHGRWEALDLQEAARHLTQHEALAWCAWAGRRLPTEAEWERAACTHPRDFRWGDVWEWTSSPFTPYPGFEPHPYRDYSAPWFDGRPVLRGASFMTQPRMRHPRYRNFFPPDRNDLAAGFRSCAR